MHQFYYIAETQFDQRDAVTNRIVNNIKAITSQNDCTVTIIGYGDAKEIIYDGITIKNVRKGKGLIQKLFYFIFRGFFVSKLLSKESIQPRIIIYYGCSMRFLFPLKQYVRRKQIKIICDIAEWYNPSHLPAGGKFSPLALDVSLGLKYFVPKCDGVIVISTFLESYFVSKNVKTIRIPVLVDTIKVERTSVNIESFDKKYLNLIYAGFPGKKDLVLNVIVAVEKLFKEGVNIRFHLLGPTMSELGIKSNMHSPSSIICHGRINQEIVPEYLKQADFSVLIRPDERYAQAGFPTKFVESLNAGLPVIANLTSDLFYYLKEGYNGFIVKDSSVNSIMEVLKKVVVLDKSKIKIMKNNAVLTAAENFDYRLFSGNFSKFFHEILNGVS